MITDLLEKEGIDLLLRTGFVVDYTLEIGRATS